MRGVCDIEDLAIRARLEFDHCACGGRGSESGLKLRGVGHGDGAQLRKGRESDQREQSRGMHQPSRKRGTMCRSKRFSVTLREMESSQVVEHLRYWSPILAATL